MQSRALKNPLLDYIYQSFSSTEHLYWYSLCYYLSLRITILLRILWIHFTDNTAASAWTTFWNYLLHLSFYQQNWQYKANTTKTFFHCSKTSPSLRGDVRRNISSSTRIFSPKCQIWLNREKKTVALFCYSFFFLCNRVLLPFSKCISSKSRGRKIALIYLIGRISEETEPSWS